MADAYPNQRTTVAPPRSSLAGGRFGGVGPFSGGPFNLGWVPLGVGILAVVGGLLWFWLRGRGSQMAQTVQAPQAAPPLTGSQAALQQSAAPAAATLVPLPYPTQGTVENVPSTTAAGQIGIPGAQPIQPTQPAAQSLGSVTLMGQPTGGQLATQPGPPYYDPTTGQVLSTADGPYFQWGQQLQLAGAPNAQGLTPVVGPQGGIVGIPTSTIQSWNNPSASSLSSFSPSTTGQGQVTA
ncbi:MAG: hypothetical protein J2P28_12045 [Actinobacteria bacterium]|nr:hypothetical protein [Actinomycetota bacterium]